MVMWYHQMLGYGNDVLNQPVKAWNQRHSEKFVEFTSRFFPHNT